MDDYVKVLNLQLNRLTVVLSHNCIKLIESENQKKKIMWQINFHGIPEKCCQSIEI